MITGVLFDFDGTLVHTAPGILAGFRRVFAEAGMTPVEPIDERVIGPPLAATIRRLAGDAAPERLAALAAAFAATYDADGVEMAFPYPGMSETLEALAGEGRRMFVVTNKRIVPARMIAERLGIAARLEGLYSPDAVAPRAANKADLVGRVMVAHRLEAAATIVVGDSADDANAAHANRLRFVAAAYGYGDPSAAAGPPPSAVLDELRALPEVLRRLD
ncbi:MAG: HAD family hydrolase [Gemmatimonadota bacterium]|nr:HAD family hydrolase [Gemmatimonadota bacterium]